MARKIVDETLKFNIIINGNDAKKEYGQLERSQRAILDANKDLEAQARKMEKANQQQSDSYIKLKRDIEANNKTYQEQEKRMTDLSNKIGINNLTMRELGNEARKLGGILSNLEPGSDKWKEYNALLQSVKGRMSNLREEMKPVEESMENQLELVSSLGLGFGQLFTSLVSGDVKGAQAALTIIQTGLRGVTQAAWAFIATPLGAALAVLAAGGAAIKFWADYNESLREATLLTQQITGLTGEQAENARRQASVMEKVYGADFKEVLGTANGLVRDFKITFDEAFETIEKGLQRGQINNNEYFDSFQEYDTFFAQAGFAAEDFRKIIQTGYDLGVYSDKLPDAIKEMDISLREQTTATRDALVNTFGAAFTDDILRGIKNGEITTKEALQEISAEASRTGINVQQNAQLTADLFRGAGEDAGGAIKIFEAYNIALNGTERALTPLEEMIRDVADANRELAEAQDAALKSDNYIALSNEISLFWTRTKTTFFQGIKFITDGFTSAGESITIFFAQTIATITNLPTVAKESFSDLKKEVFDVVATFSGMATVIDNLMSFNFSGAKDAFMDFKENFKAEVSDVGDVAGAAVDRIVKGREKIAAAMKAEFAQRKAAAAEQSAQTVTDPSTGTPINPNNGNGSGGAAPASDVEKKRLEEIKKTEEQITQFIKAQKEQRAIDAKVGLEKELALVDAKYAGQLQKAAENEELTKQLLELKEQEKNDLKVQKALELQEKLRLADEENYIAQEELRLEREILAAETQAEKDQLNLEREQFLAQQKLDAELALAEQRLELSNATEEEIFAVKQKFALAQQKLDLKYANAEKKLKDGAAEANKQRFNNEIKQAAETTGQLAELLGKQTAAGKAAAIAQATMNTYQGVTEVWRAQSVLPEPAATIAKVLSTATVVASGLKAVGVIKKQDTNVPGFQDGLYPITREQDGKVYNSRISNNAATQIVPTPTTFLAGEMPEMIIDPDTFKKLDPAITNHILSLAGRGPVPGFESGAYPVPQDNGTNEMLLAVISKLDQRLNEPIVAETYYGAEASRKQQEYDKIIKDTRTNAKIRR